jgi:rhodanese-related sulfurtransferase/membrane protein insertase Oxa1/YidC/SpoIIIJ/phosphohistidine swiveling domain-containing protein
MRTLKWGRRSAGNVSSMSSVFGALALWIVGTDQAFAIPSPELVVGSFVSLSQLFALASAVLGGGAAYAAMRVRRRGGSAEVSRGLLYTSVALFAVLVISAGINIYQYVSDSNARQERLEATLTRPMPKFAGKSLNPILKEVSYGDQLKHPRGISTGEMEKLLAAKARGELPDTMLLDIRESAETEMGTMPGAKIVRFPDVKSSNINFSGKTAILYCHDGNRGYETCGALAALGIDCRFLVGGLEKWLAENRPLTGLNARTLSDLRAVPAHRNQGVLLDTPQVRDLIDNEGAVFVDVRHPGEFANDRLPNAINLPIRWTPTEKLKANISQLPKKPVIVPCYDGRSCLFGEVLGLELDRAGYDYRGRYTVPWEYFVPSEPRPYIKTWLEQANKGWSEKGAEALAGILSHIADYAGIILAIILLACVSRLLVLPFAVKAERDQIRSRDASAEMDEMKRRLADNPAARARATRAFYKRHNITPLRNLIALLFLPIMALALMAVQILASDGHAPLGWISDIGDRDAWLILPLAFGVLITGYIDLAFATTQRKRIAIWAIALPALTATGALLSAAADVYLITSAALLIVQRLWVSGAFAAVAERWRRSRVPEGIVALTDVTHLQDCGNKSYRLGCMRAAGLPVPDGLVLTPAFLTRVAATSAAERQRELNWIWQRLGRAQLAVRSSATGEDGANNSFAGVFESILNVDRDGLEAAIGSVRASFEAERASSYQLMSGAGNVLIQRMVDAEYSGVLFTRDPSASGLAMIEMVSGTAQDLVSGTTRPRSFRFGRVTRKQFSSDMALIDLKPLLELGDRAENLFGRPQDIEWTFRDGAFFIVQSRDITRPVAGDVHTVAKQNELGRVVDLAKGAAPDEIVFGKNELSEMLPRPTPLSLSLMESLWAAGGSVELAARELGLRYTVEEQSTYLVTVLGRLYVDKREERARGLVIGPLAARRLVRTADRIEREFREEFLPRFLDESRLANVADFEKLATVDLIAEIKRLRDRFVHDTHVSIDVVNIAAGFYLDRVRKALSANAIGPSAILGHIPETFEHHALAEATAAPAKSRRWLLLKNFGHRAVLDYELAEPRYAEDINTLNRMISGRVHPSHPAARDTHALSKSQAKLVDIARRFQTLKEDAKHHSLGELAILRRAVLVLDRRFGFDGRAFYLRFDELLSLSGANAAQLRALAIARENEAGVLKRSPSLGSSLTPHDLEAASAGDVQHEHAASDGIRGTHVAGSKVIEGRARVISEDDAEIGNPLEDFRDGDIIVATMINPAWLPYFSRAGGFVSEVGGWLSHPAILAREYDVAMVVGTEGLSRITDGSRLRLHLDGRIEIVDGACEAGQAAAAA